MMELHRRTRSPLRLLSWGLAVSVVAFTVWSQRSFFVSLKNDGRFQELAKPEEIHVAEALESFMEKRMASLRSARDDAESFETYGDEDAALFYRPAVAVKAIAVHKRKKLAVIAVEGHTQTQIVQCGDSVEGITIIDIASEGITCQWRKQKYFVPLL